MQGHTLQGFTGALATLLCEKGHNRRGIIVLCDLSVRDIALAEAHLGLLAKNVVVIGGFYSQEIAQAIHSIHMGTFNIDTLLYHHPHALSTYQLAHRGQQKLTQGKAL